MSWLLLFLSAAFAADGDPCEAYKAYVSEHMLELMRPEVQETVKSLSLACTLTSHPTAPFSGPPQSMQATAVINPLSTDLVAWVSVTDFDRNPLPVDQSLVDAISRMLPYIEVCQREEAETAKYELLTVRLYVLPGMDALPEAVGSTPLIMEETLTGACLFKAIRVGYNNFPRSLTIGQGEKLDRYYVFMTLIFR